MPPYDHEQTITAYQILIHNIHTGTWTEAADCDGSKSVLVSNLYCNVPMRALREIFGYQFRELVEVKIMAYNLYGWSRNYSPVNAVGALTRVEPVQAGQIFVSPLDTTTKQVGVYWSALLAADTGDSNIISYNLQWDQAIPGGEWIDLVGNPDLATATSFIVSSKITSGYFYNFRLRAKNIYGFGVFSSVYNFKASQEPQQIPSEGISTEDFGT